MVKQMRITASVFRPMAAAMLLMVAGLNASIAAPERPEGTGASGLFLAGIVANSARDIGAAAEYFREAFQADPRNAALVDQSFLADLVDGNLPEAFKTAEKAVRRDKSNALAHVALGVRAMKANQFTSARKHFERAGGTARNADLTIALLRAWALLGAGDHTNAIASVDRFKSPELAGYRDFFGGLMADLAKKPDEAEKRLASAYKTEGGTLRVVEAYGRLLSRIGKLEQARMIFEEWRGRNPGQPYLDRQIAALQRGESLPSLVQSASDGAAEVFYGLGAVGAAARDPFTAIIYIQLAHYLTPQDDVITMTLAEFFEQLRQNERVAEVFSGIPPDSPFANRAAIGRAAALERMEKSDEAIGVLRALLAKSPGDIEAADTLGTILRLKKRWSESVSVYDAALAATPRLEQKHWVLLFGRAIGQERMKLWPRAEADFLAALDLLPLKPRTPREKAERAQVMNYLAYSWVDMHMNIEKSFDMLREAVALTPEDGAIVDSLGWAYYRLGKYDEAVRELERAILLRAGDATINDHLGDAYWRVGRQREARFKWSQALGLNPEPEDKVKIENKLANGLEAGNAAAIPPKPNGG